ncbi:tyrosine-type recombinase/integrase [Falsihalocynthiibacter sp. S25ZX9]|uniref:tyrosine-type recombinase/integrase n=1 Tax=Falsihalocynthiibacter sp. S25ZX9 TaxID=3240870 RepID=UPI00350ED8FB
MAFLIKRLRKSGKCWKMHWGVKDQKTGKTKIKTKMFDGTDKKAALLEARRIEAEMSQAGDYGDGAQPLAAFLKVWMPYASEGLSNSTLMQYAWQERVLIEWFGDLPLNKINALTFVSLGRKAKERGFQPYTIQLFTKILKRIVRDAMAWDILPPTLGPMLSTVKMVKNPRKQPPIRSIEETELLASRVRAANPTAADMLLVTAFTGVRWGEIAALTPADIDLDTKRLHIAKTVAYEKGGVTVQNAPKSKTGNRYLPLSEELIRVFTPRVNTTAEHNLLFPAFRGGPLSHSVCSKVISGPAEELGVATGWHASRHYFGSHLLRNGVPLPAVSKMMGHFSPQITASLYSWVLDNFEAEAQVLDALRYRVAKPKLRVAK